MRKFIEDFVRNGYKIWEKDKHHFKQKTLEHDLDEDELGDKNYSFLFSLRNVVVKGDDVLFFEVYLCRYDPKTKKQIFRTSLLEINNIHQSMGGIIGFLYRIHKNGNNFLEDSKSKEDKLLLRYIIGKK